jgi:hypothetical protein
MFMLSENDDDTKVHAKAKNRKQETFTLVEQDATAVETIAFWILKNIMTAPAPKLRDALDKCIRMRAFLDKKYAD